MVFSRAFVFAGKRERGGGGGGGGGEGIMKASTSKNSAHPPLAINYDRSLTSNACLGNNC